MEEVIWKHPAVADVGVTSIWDDSKATELPCAFVVAKAHARLLSRQELATDIQELVASKVAGYKRLRGGVNFVDGLPRNPTGKLLRRELRKLAQVRARM